jgi:mono/diheme cytochrome c family protein
VTKKWKKVGLGVFGVVGLLFAGVGGFAGYKVASYPPTYPDTPHPTLKPSTDPEIIAKGQYLVDAVAHCTTCHTTKEDLRGRDSIAGLLPSGGQEWDMGPMGTLRSPNITSDVETGIGAMSDEEFARIMKHAVGADDEPALLMVAVGPMADEDLVAIMSYIRSLPPVKNEVPPGEFSAMGKVVMPMMAAAYVAPKPDWDLPPRVDDGKISVERGAYLANGPAFCFACHSQPVLSPRLGVAEPRFAGCITADPDPLDPEMEMCAPNLTPDPDTGHITDWSEDTFVERVRAGRTVDHSPMPWENYALMTDNDLRSIYQYLRSLAPTARVTGPPYRKAGWEPS